MVIGEVEAVVHAEISSRLPEVLQYHGAMVCPGLDIASQGGTDVSKCEVPRVPQDETLGRPSVSTGAPGLLVVGLERRRWPPMEYLPDVRLVYAHPERTGRDNDVQLIGEERQQNAPADACAEPGVIGSRAHARSQQRARDQLRQPSSGR